ncbi:MAG: VIT1/CCC1 transporter family protein [Actinobacteria bacterium]|nr:VIT1/CCC1 transporter family protein [Actinomycetota bacterium]
MAKRADQYIRYLQAERGAARLYRSLAELTDGDRREALLELADIEDKHSAHWLRRLEELGVAPPPDDDSLGDDDVALLNRARQLSLDEVLPDLEAAEREAESVYDAEPDASPEMVADEHEHAKVLSRMRRSDTAAPKLNPDQVRDQLNSAEPWHRTDKSGSLRAAVFGVSDGLVSNTALVMGFAGSGISSTTVLFAGFAGLLAGAFSMGAGEYVSVSSQRDIFRREIAIEAAELKEKPQEEQRELELLYRAKGLSREAARDTAAQIMSDPDTALDTLAREELGLDPGALGSPIKVALSSFVAFAVGAIVPVIPYLFSSDTLALILSIIFAVIALLVVGGTVGRLSGLGITKSALRQLLVGGGAAAVTYIIGSFVGIGLG